MLLLQRSLVAAGLAVAAAATAAGAHPHDHAQAWLAPLLAAQVGVPALGESNPGQGLSSTASWVSWLSGFGWGEGSLKLLDPKTRYPEDATFLTRSASFTPRLGSPPAAPPADPSEAPRNVSNPFFGSLVGITSLALPDPLPAGWNATLDMHACSAASGKHPKRGSAALAVGSNETEPSPPWIALAVRGQCSFAAKVRLAQALGARAVVVGDEALWGESEAAQRQRQNLLTMFSPDETDDLVIPAVFVSRATYLALTDELAASPHGAVDVKLEDTVEWEYPLLDLLLLLLLLPSLLTLATLGLHHMRMVRRRRKERATPSAIEALEVRTWSADGWEKAKTPASSRSSSDAGGGDDNDDGASRISVANGSRHGDTLQPPPQPAEQEASGSHGPSALGSPRSGARRLGNSADRLHRLLHPSGRAPSSTPPPPDLRPRAYYNTQECAICLDAFKVGDRVRILPCGHLFHVAEVDQWLTSFKKICPSCKADITKPFPSTHRKRTPAARSSATETTPLLAPAPVPTAADVVVDSPAPASYDATDNLPPSTTSSTTSTTTTTTSSSSSADTATPGS